MNKRDQAKLRVAKNTILLGMAQINDVLGGCEHMSFSTNAREGVKATNRGYLVASSIGRRDLAEEEWIGADICLLTSQQAA